MVRKFLIGILGLIVLAAAGVFVYYRLFIYKPPAISEMDRSSVNIMPLPASLKLKGGKFIIASDFKITFDGYEDENIKIAARRFLDRLSNRTNISFLDAGESPRMIVTCQNSGGEILQGMEDESYSLKVDSRKIILGSRGPLGVIRGFETLLQLLENRSDTPYFPGVEILDSARFPWRGLMIDVCRHWMPKEVIIRNLNAMAAVKLNVLHLHLSDDQGFRVESKVFPRLHEAGSMGKYYTQSDIEEIIEYAFHRGIRVIPEFDMPGHTKSWQIAYPEIGSVSYHLEFGQKKGEFYSPALDPSNEEVYIFLDSLLGEMSELFPDPYFHIGGDEVNPSSWNENEDILQFMKKNDLKDARSLQTYFNKRINGILKRHDKIMIGWEEILNKDLGDNTVIQSWKTQKTLFEAVQMGGYAILSSGYYLDQKLPAQKHYLVDPAVLPGAVDIVPDYENWKMYDLQIEVPGNIMEGQLILFDKDPENAYGFFAFLEDRNAFKNATIEDGKIKFLLNTPVGDLEFAATLDEDTIAGNLSLGFLKFGANGKRTGGSDIEGSTMPAFEVLKPLNEDEQKRILGGEAAMWSEVVSSETIDSRIWPRAAAIAEKLWSLAELTGNIDDMYRRLEVVSNVISLEGSRHLINYEAMLKEVAGTSGYKSLKTLVDVMEEVKYYNRLAFILDMDSVYLPDLELKHIADIASPESFQARAFNRLIDSYEEHHSKEIENQIYKQFEIWSVNHSILSRFISGNQTLEEIDSISAAFSTIAGLLIKKNSNNISEEEMEMLFQNLDYIENGESGVLIAVAPGLRKLALIETSESN